MNTVATSITPVFSHETAGKIMATQVPVFLVSESLSHVEEVLRKDALTFKTINYIYFVDEARKLVGVLSIKELLCCSDTYTVEQITTKKIFSVTADTDQEHIAFLALKHSIKAVPVVDDSGVFLGVVSSDTILSILHSESIEDALHHTGTVIFEDPLASLRTGSAWLHFKKRIPWLIMGLGGGIGAALVIEAFESTLEQLLILATFIPLVVYMADAVGSQSQTIFIRSLALPDTLSIRGYIFRELKVTAMIALSLSAIMFIVLSLWFASFLVGTIVALTILCGVSVSVLIAMTLPYTFKKFNFDPALASGPFATVLCDTSSLLIYFCIASLIL